jgi:hypothetical protein
VTHVDGVSNETTVVEGNLDSLGVGRGGEFDGEGGSIGLKCLVGDLNSRGTSGVALKVGGSVDLVAELGDVGVLGGGLEDRLLDRVGSRDQKGTIKEEKGDTVVETCDGRLRTGGEALTLGLVGVVDEDLESRVLGNTETLSTLLGTVDPNDGSVSKKSSLNHTTALRHRVHLPSGVGIEGLDATTGWVTRRSDVLVRTTTTDDNIRVPLVGAGKSHHNRATGVGVGAVSTGKIGKSANDITSANIENLSRLGDLDEKVAVLHQVEEGVHVVRLVLAEDLHVDGLALGSTVGVEHLIGGVVVLRLGRVKTVQGARGNEDLVVGHDLDRRIPTSSVELWARLIPCLTIKGSIRSRALEEADALETIANGGVNEVERSVTTERNKSSISKEDTARAESIGLVSQRSQLLCVRVVLRRVGVLSVGKLELGVVLDLVKEDNLTVRHQTSVHSRDTRAALDLNSSGPSGSGSWAGLGGGDGRRVDTRTRLATFTTVSSGVATVSVHRAARSLGPVTADGVCESGTAASIGSLNASRLNGRNLNARGLTKHRLARCSGRGRTGGSSGSGSGLCRSGVLAAILAAIGNKAVAVSRSTVSVRAAASTVRAVGIARGTTEVLTAPAVVPRRDCCGLGSDRLGFVVAARKTSSSTVTLSGSALMMMLVGTCLESV